MTGGKPLHQSEPVVVQKVSQQEAVRWSPKTTSASHVPLNVHEDGGKERTLVSGTCGGSLLEMLPPVTPAPGPAPALHTRNCTGAGTEPSPQKSSSKQLLLASAPLKTQSTIFQNQQAEKGQLPAHELVKKPDIFCHS